MKNWYFMISYICDSDWHFHLEEIYIIEDIFTKIWDIEVLPK